MDERGAFLERKDIFSRENVDIMAIVEAFPEAVRPWLIQGLQHIQFYDGCSVGCPWCGFDVSRKVTSGFDFESWIRFANHYLSEMPNTVALYWASDPLEIAGIRQQDGRIYDYVDLLRETLPYLRTDQYFYTTTSLPQGTDEVLIKLYQFSHDEWQKKAIPGVPVPFHTVRVSVTEKNKERADRLLERVKRLGLDPGFLRAITDFLLDRSLNKVKKVGKFIRHPKRGRELPDFDTVACYDGTLIRPDGIYSIWAEAATRKGPFGMGQVKLEAQANVFEIPKYVRTIDYAPNLASERLLSGSYDLVIPDVVIQRIDKRGKLIGEVSLLTSRRLGMQLFYFLATILNVSEDKFVKGGEKALRAAQIALTELTNKMDLFERGEYIDMDDEEAVWLVNDLWDKIRQRMKIYPGLC